MPGMMTLDELKKAVESGEIDTVIVAQTDMQGRLMGKRFHARHFLDSGVNETHSCNYLLTVDMEMEPVPGYKSASWQQGYGDYTMKPDLSTLRRIPWQQGPRWCCATWKTITHASAVSPRAILKKQLQRLEAMGFSAMMATELEFYLFEESFEEAHASWATATST
jgi:glutamine synthetase